MKEISQLGKVGSDGKILKGLRLTPKTVQLIELAKDAERAEGKPATQASVVEAAIRRMYGRLLDAES